MSGRIDGHLIVKFEARISKYETISKFQVRMIQTVLNFGHSEFGFVSDFEFTKTNKKISNH